MFRNSLNGSRDMSLTRSNAGGKLSGTGTWKINSCPMDGGGLVIDNGQPVAAWCRDKDVFLARAGQQETRLGAGHDVALARTGKGVYVARTGGHGPMVPC